MNTRQTAEWKRRRESALQVVAKGETKKIRELRKRLDKENDASEISGLISAIHALEEYMEKGKAAREKRKKDKADKLKAAPPPEATVEADAIVEKNEPNPMGPGGPKMQPRYELENGPKESCADCGMEVGACACMAAAAGPCPACGSESPANDDGSCVDCRCDKATRDALNNERHADAGSTEQLVEMIVSQTNVYRQNHANNEPTEAVLDIILQQVRQQALDQLNSGEAEAAAGGTDYDDHVVDSPNTDNPSGAGSGAGSNTRDPNNGDPTRSW